MKQLTNNIISYLSILIMNLQSLAILNNIINMMICNHRVNKNYLFIQITKMD